VEVPPAGCAAAQAIERIVPATPADNGRHARFTRPNFTLNRPRVVIHDFKILHNGKLYEVNA
jgi:hypothetical protein